MLRKTIATAIPVIATAVMTAGSAFAQAAPDVTIDKLPAPGVLALVAAGIAGAIALAKLRK